MSGECSYVDGQHRSEETQVAKEHVACKRDTNRLTHGAMDHDKSDCPDYL